MDEMKVKQEKRKIQVESSDMNTEDTTDDVRVSKRRRIKDVSAVECEHLLAFTKI
jgi:hypothetical protein